MWFCRFTTKPLNFFFTMMQRKKAPSPLRLHAAFIERLNTFTKARGCASHCYKPCNCKVIRGVVTIFVFKREGT
ncbi:hypothetical protein BSK61_23455 [Paenibacillus odorifer]|nr:hypothetical protein BSK61_23455 [Paenibacillus odorifer]